MTQTSRREFFRLAGAGALGAAAFGLAGCGSKGNEPAPEPAAKEAIAGVPGRDINFTKETEVLIIGAGPGGMLCALQTSAAGIKTLVVDKTATYGGCGITSGGTHNSSGSKYGKDNRDGDYFGSVADLTESMVTFAEKRKRPDFAKQMLVYSGKVIDVLVGLGVKFREEGFHNSLFKNMYIPEEGVGQLANEFKCIYDADVKQGTEFLFNLRAVNLIVNGDGEVCGARFVDTVKNTVTDIKAKDVVLATGSFASNQELIAKYLPDYVNLGCKTTTSMGEGIALGESVGGVLVYPSVPNLTSHSTCVYVCQRFGRSISVLPNGKRFYNEYSTHAAAKGCIEAGCGNWWSIWDDEIQNGPNAKQVATAGDALVTANTLEELAEKTSIPYAELKATFDRYDAICDAGEDTDFKRTTNLEKLVPPYYAFNNHPQRYKTVGGMDLDENAHMVDKSGKVIPHMYAAGIMGLLDYSADLVPAFASGLFCGDNIVADYNAAK